MAMRITKGAASMSYDVQRGGRTVATVWSGDRAPTWEKAHNNALILAAAHDMRDALRAAIERLEYLGDEAAIVGKFRRALPKMPEGEA